MADHAFFVMAGMLLVTVFSAGACLVVAVFALALIARPATRAIGLGVFLAGMVGIAVTDSLVFIARTTPSATDQLPEPVRLLTSPLAWAFLVPRAAFAYTASTLFGFAWAGGVASFVAIIWLLRRRRRSNLGLEPGLSRHC